MVGAFDPNALKRMQGGGDPTGAGLTDPNAAGAGDVLGGGGGSTMNPHPGALGSAMPAGGVAPTLNARGGKYGVGAGIAQPFGKGNQGFANAATGKGGGGQPLGGNNGGGGEATPPGPDITIDNGGGGIGGAQPLSAGAQAGNLGPNGQPMYSGPRTESGAPNPPSITQPTGNPGSGQGRPAAAPTKPAGAGPIPTTTNPPAGGPFAGLPPGGTNVPYGPNGPFGKQLTPAELSGVPTYNPKTGQWSNSTAPQGPPTTTNPQNPVPFSGLPPGGTTGTFGPLNTSNGIPANQARRRY